LDPKNSLSEYTELAGAAKKNFLASLVNPQYLDPVKSRSCVSGYGVDLDMARSIRGRIRPYPDLSSDFRFGHIQSPVILDPTGSKPDTPNPPDIWPHPDLHPDLDPVHP